MMRPGAAERIRSEADVLEATIETARENILKGRVAAAFVSPIAAYAWPASEGLNEGLREVILSREADSQGIAKSNVGGWSSEKDLLRWGGPHIATLLERMHRFAIDMTALALTEEGRAKPRSFVIQAWANVLRDGNYNTIHHHFGSHWSGVYYVATGKPAPDIPINGKLELLDPRSGIGMVPFEGSIFENRYLIDPRPGLMVMFPSWLNHFVHPFRGAGERISVPFNVVARLAERA